MSYALRQCPTCQEKYRPHTHKQRFCSRDCFHKTLNRRQRNCVICDSTYFAWRPSQLACSNPCAALLRSGPGNYLWQEDGSRSINKAGYAEVKIDGVWKLEHRHVMEEHLGRPLLPFPLEIVHHRDGNKLNNTIDNLQLTTPPAHRREHFVGFRSDTHKQCRKCLLTKPRTEFDSGRRKEGCDPSHPECKACRSAYYAQRFREGRTSYHRKQAEKGRVVPPRIKPFKSDTHKECTKCRVILPLSAFQPKPSLGPNSYHSHCRPCKARDAQDRRASRPKP